MITSGPSQCPRTYCGYCRIFSMLLAIEMIIRIVGMLTAKLTPCQMCSDNNSVLQVLQWAPEALRQGRPSVASNTWILQAIVNTTTRVHCHHTGLFAVPSLFSRKSFTNTNLIIPRNSKIHPPGRWSRVLTNGSSSAYVDLPATTKHRSTCNMCDVQEKEAKRDLRKKHIPFTDLMEYMNTWICFLVIRLSFLLYTKP